MANREEERERIEEEEDIRPPKATRREIDEEEVPEPPLRQPRGVGTQFNLGNGSLVKTAVVSLIVALVVFMLMGAAGGGGLVTKKDFTTNLASVSTAITQLKADVTKQQSEAKAAVEGIPNVVTNAVNQALSQLTQQINTLSNKVEGFNNSIQSNNARINELSSRLDATKNEMETLTNKIASLETLTNKIASLETKVVSLETKVTDYGDRIDDLEKQLDGQQQQGTSAPASAVTSEVKSWSNVLMPSSDTVMSSGVRVTLTNTTNTAINDIILDIFVQTNQVVPNSVASLTGGGTVWQRIGVPSGNIMDFVNTQWGLKLKAGETKHLYLNLTITGTGTTFLTDYPYGVQFQVEANVM